VKVQARVGIEPAGRNDARSSDITWSPWQPLKSFSRTEQISAKATNSVVRLFVQCRSEGELGNALAVFILDDVRRE
jgi:hypothetical protein